MKILGLALGRKMENTEILVKEALMAAEETGARVEMIRALDLDIKPCRGCIACVQSLMTGGPGNCVIKDDLPFLDEHLMDCDGLILGAPVYIMSPAGLLKTIADRRGPSHDVAFRMEAKNIWAGGGREKPCAVDERSFKKRAAAFISVGGAKTPHWASMGLPLMHLFTFPSHMTVVDQMQLLNSGRTGHVALNDPALARAGELGRHVAESVGAAGMKWLGDEPGTCPVCHSNLLTVGSTNPVECPICGISGELKVDGDRISVFFSEEEQKKSRLTIAGKLEHFLEIRANTAIMMEELQRNGQELAARLEKYQGYREVSKKSG